MVPIQKPKRPIFIRGNLVFQIGNTSVDWNTPTNWENHMVPVSSTNVSILPTALYWPTKTGSLTIGTDCNSLNMASAYTELTVTGDLIISSGKSFYIDPSGIPNIYVGGNWTDNGTFTPGQSTVEFNSSFDKNANANSSNNSNISTLFAATTQATSNYFDISASGGLDVLIESFDINCNTTGSVSIEVWYRTDSYVGHQNNTAGWIQLGTTQSVSGSGINLPTHVNPGASITIPSGANYGFFISCYSGTTPYILYTTGAFSYNDSYVSIVGGDGSGTTQPGNGNLYTPRTFNGTIYYSYTIPGLMSFWNLSANKQNAVLALNSNSIINNDFTIKPGAQFTNSSGNIFNVTGNTTFEADATGMASFIDNGTTNFSNPPNVQQYLTNNKWHYTSIPVTGAQSGVYTGIYLRTFNEPSDSWNSYITGTAVPLDNTMMGYAAWADGSPATIVFNGPLKTGPYNIAVTNQSSGSDAGWNLVGNPYPSSLDWDASLGWD